MLPNSLLPAINAIVPANATHIGFIAVDHRGDFALALPARDKWGTTATFTKERLLNGERPAAALLRCLAEFGPTTISGVYPVQPLWATAGSVSFHFAGLIRSRDERKWPNAHGHMGWFDINSVRNLLTASGNPQSRERDLAILASAQTMCLSPHHRVLLMLRELHLMGYEQLRAPAYHYPIAWRCPIVPASWTLKSHGGVYRDPRKDSAPLALNRKGELAAPNPVYSSAQGQQPFGWNGVEFASPRDLAQRFLQEFPSIAALGWGPDGAYVRWFEDILPQVLSPYRLYAAYGEFEEATDHLYCDDINLPLPPSGYLDDDNFKRFMEG